MIVAFLQVFCAFFSGIIEAGAIANEALPLGSPLLALFSLAPLYVAAYRAPSYRRSYWLFFIQAITVHLCSSFWLANFRDFAIFTLGASAVGTGWLCGMVGIFFHLMPAQDSPRGLLEEGAGKRPFASFSRMLWFCACWLLWEWFKSNGFLAYPWGTLFVAAYRWKIFTQIADITGVWGVSFLYALASALLGEGILLLRILPHAQAPRARAADYRQAARWTATLFAACGIYGIVQYSLPREPLKTLNTLIVQQNSDPWEDGSATAIAISKRLTDAEAARQRAQQQEPELVLWSEGVLRRSFPTARFYYEAFPEDESLCAFIKRTQAPFIIGGEALVNVKKKHYTNSAIFFDKDGTYTGFYSKMHLVPFAEAIPFADSPLVQTFMNRILHFSDGWTAGTQLVLFTVPLAPERHLPTPLEYGMAPRAVIPLSGDGTARADTAWSYVQNTAENPDNFVAFTTPICFEDAFPDLCRQLYSLGSEVFMNITNDSWSKTRSAEYQHFVAASYRAIELRTTLVRCANAGYSVVVAPNGRVVADLPLFTESALQVAVPVYRRSSTIYYLLGDWLVYCMMAGATLYVLRCLLRLYRPAMPLPFARHRFHAYS